MILINISAEYKIVKMFSATSKKGSFVFVGSYAIITAEFRPMTVMDIF